MSPFGMYSNFNFEEKSKYKEKLHKWKNKVSWPHQNNKDAVMEDSFLFNLALK